MDTYFLLKKGGSFGQKKTLRELERRISEHFYNEAKIMKDMLEANLTKEDSKELERFIKNHPFSSLSHYLQELSRLKES